MHRRALARFAAVAAAAALVVVAVLGHRTASAQDPARPVAAADEERPVVPTAGASVVTVGFHVFQVREVDLKAQTFYVDFYYWFRYRATDEEKGKEIERTEFMNGKLDTREELDRKIVNGETYVCWRAAGTFSFTAELRNYPFDTQRFEIVLEHPVLETDAIVYADDEKSYGRSRVPRAFWGAKESVDIPEFSLKGTERTASEAVYHTDFGDPSRQQPASTYSRFKISMRFARDFMPYFFKIVIPLIVIMAMAYLVFFLPPKEIQTASALSVTALLSCIAFNLTVAGNLPDVGYLIVSDKFFLATYILLFFTLFHSVVTFIWEDRGKHALAEKWERTSRIVFPVLYVGAFVYLLVGALTSGRG